MLKIARIPLLLLMICCPRVCQAADLTLGWDPPIDGVTTGYTVYFGTASHSYSQHLDVGAATSYTVTGLAPATTYFFVVVAHDADGEVSAPSNEIDWTTDASVRTNVALASNGAVALASSSYSADYAPSGAINGDRRGQPWGNGAGWNDATPDQFPDVLEVQFNGAKTIDEIDLFSVQDNYAAPVEPTETLTFTLYGLQAFNVEYWTGAAWQLVSGGSIANNTLVWRRMQFSPVTTTKIRVTILAALSTWSRVTEVEAWTVGVDQPPTRTNVALAANGGTASASTAYSAGYAASGANNGDRSGASWGNGGGWNDATPNQFPDTLEIQFDGAKTIDEIDVFSLQDNYQAPVDPTANMTFTLYGLRNFDVQYWTGTEWRTVTGGSILANNLVWRKIAFDAITTTKIRVVVNGTLDLWSRVTEIEAWTAGV